MAGGPIFPHSAYPADTAGRLFPNFHVGTVATLTVAKYAEGLGVMASLSADAVWALQFQMPPSLPTGTAKLQLNCFANATSGVIRINPKWCSVAAGVNPFNTTLSAEGVTPDTVTGFAGSGDTATFGAADADQFLLLKWTLNATTAPAAGELVNMGLTFETASWTLAAVLTVQPSIIWE